MGEHMDSVGEQHEAITDKTEGYFQYHDHQGD